MKELQDKDTSKMVAAINEIVSSTSNFKNNISKLWEKCIYYANGDQDNYPETASIIVNNQFTTTQHQQQNRRRRVYQTNEIEPIIRTLVSFMTRSKPAVEVYPADETDHDKKKARVGEKILQAKYDIDHEYFNSTLAAHWALTIGTAYRKDFWNPGKGNIAELPQYDETGNLIMDEQQKVSTRETNIGGNEVQILTPFTVTRDNSVIRFDDIEWIHEMYMIDADWVKEAYDKKEPGYTGLANEIQDGAGPMYSTLSLYESLKYHVPFGNRGASPTMRNKVVFEEFYARPQVKLPKGRYLAKVGDIPVYDSMNNGQDLGSPYYMPYQDIMWHPYTEWGFELYIGRALWKGLVEQLLQLQGRLNEINGAILENANTMAKVDILAAENQLKRGVIRGGGGNVYTYKPRPDALPPQKWPGVPLPAQFFKEKADLIEQMARIAGTNFVMQGTPPSGVSAASAIQQLLENANTQFSDLMTTWEKFHEQGYTKKLRLIRQFNKLPDKDLIDYIRTLSRDSLDSEINAFTGEDLGDGWTVKVEAGSQIPKSEKFKKDIYREFAMAGLLGPVGEDSARGSKLRKELLSKFGETGFETEENTDVEKSKWENDRALQALPIQVDKYDNDQIHMESHRARWNAPNFIERAAPEAKQILWDHMQQHEEKIAMQQQEQMAMEQEQMAMEGALSTGTKASGGAIKKMGKMEEITPKEPEAPGIQYG